MTPKLPQSRRARRAALGAELKRLRQLAGVSGRAVASAVGVNQSTVSRMEAGETSISLPEVERWAIAVGATDEDVARLEWMAEQAVTETIPIQQWKQEIGTAGIQGDVARLEQASHLIINYQPCFVPGLLQTAGYARRVLTITRGGDDDLDSAIATRMARQQILFESSRRFEFIIAEAALRWRAGPTDILPPQYDRIASMATLDHITVSVIPSDADMHAVSTCAFVVYEEREDGEKPLATVETPDQRFESVNVEPYHGELNLLRRSVLSQADSIAFIRELALPA